MKTTFLVKSSSSTGLFYEVIYAVFEGRMTVHCNCKAGLLKTWCKHRLELISGRIQGLCDPTQAELLCQINATPQGQILAQRLAHEEASLRILEKEKALITLKEKEVKRNISTLLVNGAL